jgi:GT2 family glycosyltransferase
MKWTSTERLINFTKNYSFLLPKDFDYKFYIGYHPDLQQAEIDTEQKAKEHYLLFGINENRPYKKINIEKHPYIKDPKPEFWKDSKNLLYFSPNAPDYDKSSGGNRLLEILKILKQDLKYNVYFFCNGTSSPRYIEVLTELNINTYLPESIQQRYHDDTLKALIKQNIIFDYAIFSWHDIAHQYMNIVKKYYPQCKIIVDSVDVHWLRDSRGIANKKLKISNEILEYKKQIEKMVYNNADVIFAITEDDKKEIQKEIGYYHNIKILSNIHDKKKITLGKDIFFIGNYDHGPNVDAALQSISIYKNFQATSTYKKLQYKPKLYIAGPNYDINIQVAAQHPNITLLGHVESLSDLYSKCCLLLAPLSWGAGIKGKICDSGMCGVPVLTSDIGNEGINFKHQENALIANTDKEFVESLEYFFSLSEKQKTKLGLATQNHLYKIVPVSAAKNILKHTLESKHIVISIVAYSQTEKLAKCLDSILSKTKYNNYSIVISDNSPNNQIKNYIQNYLAKYKNKIRYIKNKNNLYFIEANNNIINDQLYNTSDIVLLNDDIEIVSEYWLNYLYSSAYSADYIAAVGGKTIYPNGLLCEAGAELYNDGSGKNIGRGQNPNESMYNRPRYVGYCSGCLLYMKRDAIKKIGALDTSLEKMYYEDSEWQYRAHINGLKTLYDPRCEAIHNEGSSSGTDIDRGAKKYQEINRIKFLNNMKQLNVLDIEIYNHIVENETNE